MMKSPVKDLLDNQTLTLLKKWGLLVLLVTLPLTTLYLVFGKSTISTQKEAEEQPTAVFQLSSVQDSYGVGEEFQANVQIKTQEEVVIAKAVLEFDPQHLQVARLEGGEDFPGQMKLDYSNEQGSIVIEQNIGASKDIKISRGTLDFATISFIPINKTTKTSLQFQEDACYAVSMGANYLNLSFSNLVVKEHTIN